MWQNRDMGHDSLYCVKRRKMLSLPSEVDHDQKMANLNLELDQSTYIFI